MENTKTYKVEEVVSSADPVVKEVKVKAKQDPNVKKMKDLSDKLKVVFARLELLKGATTQINGLATSSKEELEAKW